MHSVTIVMPSASPLGGAEEALLQLIKSEGAKSWRWQVIFLEPGGLVDVIRPHVAESLVVPCGRTRQIIQAWNATGKIAQLAKTFGSELIFGWIAKGHVYGGIAAWRSKLPAAWFQMGHPNGSVLDRLAAAIPARSVLACSNFIASEQRKYSRKSCVEAVALGFDAGRFKPDSLPSPSECRRQLGLPEDHLIVGTVGRMQRWKGMHVFIDAMNIVINQKSGVHGLIVGGPFAAEPEYEGQLREQVSQLNLARNITFAGSQKDVPRWMQAMDIFVHTSEKEPFGIVVVEAMSLGKKVIATIPGGPEQIIEHGVNGWLTPHGDSKKLASSIIAALEAEDGVAKAALGRSVSYSSEAFAKRTLAAISGCL